MEKINIHNYEAYFLDFAEGNLSQIQVLELEAFLNAHPELRDELEAFEMITLTPNLPESDEWTDLKKPGLEDLKRDFDLRDAFFARAVENQLSPLEKKILNELIADPTFKKEYKLWQNTVLLSGNEKVEKQDIFQFGLDREVSDFNYEYYLIARTEGLLSPEQNAALEKFAKTRPNGARDLEVADRLALTPPAGIFYPDKQKLYKKDKPVVFLWFYRAATVAAVLILGVFIWNSVSTPFADKAPIAGQDKQGQVHTTDSLKKTANETPDTIPNTETIEEPLLEDWEVREPDPIEYAEANSVPDKVEEKEDTIEIQERILESLDILEVQDLVASNEIPELIEDTPVDQGSEEKNSDHQGIAERASTSKNFNSIPKYAENLLADKLNIPESEKDEIGVAVARKLTARTGELLNTEYKKEENNTEGDESLTYTLRIGNFKLSHTKAK